MPSKQYVKKQWDFFNTIGNSGFQKRHRKRYARDVWQKTNTKCNKWNKKVNRRWKQDKKDNVEQLAQQAENASGKGDIKSIYKSQDN